MVTYRQTPKFCDIPETPRDNWFACILLVCALAPCFALAGAAFAARFEAHSVEAVVAPCCS